MTFKICMIEDDSDLANIVREHLIRYDFEVFICEDFKNIDYSGKIAVVIGNEGKGISESTIKHLDFNVKIPMYGTTNSLNASVAAALMIYEIVRKGKDE